MHSSSSPKASLALAGEAGAHNARGKAVKKSIDEAKSA